MFTNVVAVAAVTIALAALASVTAAQSSCTPVYTPTYPTPSIGIPNWEARLLATGLATPRSLVFDSAGHLLVLERNRGISSHTLTNDSCASIQTSRDVIQDETVSLCSPYNSLCTRAYQAQLNHGIALSEDGTTLYASSPQTVFAWPYDPVAATIDAASRREIITGMSDLGHETRTLLVSRVVPGWLLVSWGSQSNVDPAALEVSSGVSQVKAFNVSEAANGPLDYATNGTLLGWGLRNEVGIGEHPVTGGIWGVENSVDQLSRSGTDIHENNPGEELNFLGYLNGTQAAEQGGFFGYPICFAAWDTSEIPNYDDPVGTQFAIGEQNATVNDTYCTEDTIAPRLTFFAHMAPLDILFDPNGTAAWISFHGSWNRDVPVGYKVSIVEFDATTGQPLEPANSTTAAIDVMSNQDVTTCSEEGACFRPVGLARDAQGRIYVASDDTGEIWVMSSTTANNTVPTETISNNGTEGSGTVTEDGDAATGVTTPSPGGANNTWGQSLSALWVAFMLVAFFV